MELTICHESESQNQFGNQYDIEKNTQRVEWMNFEKWKTVTFIIILTTDTKVLCRNVSVSVGMNGGKGKCESWG